jgi:peptide-methionine (S)-S-oxide reductase
MSGHRREGRRVKPRHGLAAALRHGLAALLIGLALSLTALAACSQAGANALFPDPVVDDPLVTGKGQETVVLAGGCFWGIEAVFEHMKGVAEAVSGYSGGSSATASYELVGSGKTGHAESVKLTYDPSRISYGQILKVFFSVAHDPTQLNRQGPDTGTQYRSVIFFNNESQQRIATSYIAQLDSAGLFKRRIVTEVVALRAFYPGEPYHQHYAARNPSDLYIVINDRPKVDALRKQYPEWYVESH